MVSLPAKISKHRSSKKQMFTKKYRFGHHQRSKHGSYDDHQRPVTSPSKLSITTDDTMDFTSPQTALSSKKNMENESKNDEKLTEEEKKGKIQKAVII
ncbi:unnamed protein product [Onchocerca flexuosa]|uniref:Ovule protein n=1 Tax=Onchocerca flexuosa TaxID=387005 RepID=A0A183HNV4_9BILA|nr:unnamed protein product [Onchocerca flexuosa]